MVVFFIFESIPVGGEGDLNKEISSVTDSDETDESAADETAAAFFWNLTVDILRLGNLMNGMDPQRHPGCSKDAPGALKSNNT